MPEPPQLAPLDVEEQRLYSELLPDGRASHPISEGVPGHPTEEAHFRGLYPGFRSFVHDPKFMIIDEGRPTGKSRALLFGSALSSTQRTDTASQLLRQLH
ncbi:hypothetical protein ILYODFUR_033338 [Ilyodon furcidens]|uniref:Uncharacterized protein n=1 Tax=Ilyodon furcidens TaxID=33524 RepID=A0ABV0VJ68_9TELE